MSGDLHYLKTVRLVGVLVAAAITAAGTAGCGMWGPPKLATEILVDLEALSSGFSVGLNSLEFGNRLVTVKAKYDRLSRENPRFVASKQAEHFKRAVQTFIDLHQVWREKISHRRGYGHIADDVRVVGQRHREVGVVLAQWDAQSNGEPRSR